MQRIIRALAYVGVIMAAGILFAFGLVTAGLADGLPGRGKIGQPYQPPLSEVTPYNWTGIYLGLGVGYGMVNSEVSVGEANINGLGAEGWRPDMKLGYDYRLGGPVVLGVFGTWTPDGWGDADFNTNLGLTASLSPTYALGARIGLVMANNNLIYLGYKYQWADISVSGEGSRATQGHGVLGGIEMPLIWVGGPLGATFAVEGGYTRLDAVMFDEVRVQSDDFSVMARLNFRLSTFGGGN